MRTTLTLDPEAASLIRRAMAESGASFKEVANSAIVKGLSSAVAQPFETRTFDMGVPTVDLDRALRLAGQLEDAELIHKMELGANK